MRQRIVVGLIVLASLAACALVPPHPSPAANAEPSGVHPSPPGGKPGPAATDSNADASRAAAVPGPAPPVAPSPPGPAVPPRSAPDRAVAAKAPAPVPGGGAAPSTAAAAAKPAAAVPKAVPASPAAARPPDPPSLDLTALEQRLRDTHAVGLFTKLSLKNQVDDLLDQVRSYYRASKPPPPAGLRQRYDGLLLKVLSVLQEGDPPLAAQIWSSREAIWGVLADPAKLEKI